MSRDLWSLLFSQQIHVYFSGKKSCGHRIVNFHTIHLRVHSSDMYVIWYLSTLWCWHGCTPVNHILYPLCVDSTRCSTNFLFLSKMQSAWHVTCSSHLSPVMSGFNACPVFAIEKMLYEKIWYSLWCLMSKVDWLRMEWSRAQSPPLLLLFLLEGIPGKQSMLLFSMGGDAAGSVRGSWSLEVTGRSWAFLESCRWMKEWATSTNSHKSAFAFGLFYLPPP